MLKLFVLVLAVMVAFGADDPWAKVKDLKTGSELRITKTNAKQPVIAKMDELTDDALVVVVKNEQVAIPREEIERIEYRPAKGSAHVVNETKTTMDLPDGVGPRPQGSSHSGGTSTSSGSSVQFGSRGEFETVYRRTAAPAKKE